MNVQDATHERDLFEKLADLKRCIESDPNKNIVTERMAFLTNGSYKDAVRIDLYTNILNKITIYEGKKYQTSSKDVYQLRMYWDGLVYDGVKPDLGILVADEHPDSVLRMIQHVNHIKDAEGRNYNIVAKTWSELGIDY